MNPNDLTTLIGTVGFPIVAYGAMFWYMVKQNQSHKEEMDKLSQALNNNTIALQELKDKFDYRTESED